jgi:hypothetical protein
MLGKLDDKYHINFFNDTVFNAAVLCTTSVLQFLLLPPNETKKGKLMKEELIFINLVDTPSYLEEFLGLRNFMFSISLVDNRF